MYKSVSIENFRCFDKLEIEGFKRVNLIAGKNNMGKTTLLEALFLLSGYTNPGLPLKLSVFRGISEFKLSDGTWIEILYGPLFTEYNTSKAVKLSAELLQGKKRYMEFKTVNQPETPHKVEEASGDRSADGSRVIQLVSSEGMEKHTFLTSFTGSGLVSKPGIISLPFPARFLVPAQRIKPKPNAELFGELELIRKHHSIVQALKSIDDRLQSLSVIVTADNPIIHADMGGDRLIPLNYVGDGIVNLTSMLASIGNCSKGVVLIDEIENGFHHSILVNIWQAINHAAREFDVQVFATTHSWECIVAAHEAFKKEKDYDFRLYRLERLDDKINAVAYEKEILQTAIENGMEVR